jgi:hypothetical protein
MKLQETSSINHTNSTSGYRVLAQTGYNIKYDTLVTGIRHDTLLKIHLRYVLFWDTVQRNNDSRTLYKYFSPTGRHIAQTDAHMLGPSTDN